MATDLRLISALLHVLKNVERMGDQCVNICKMIPLSGNEPPADEEMVKLILTMGRQARTLISQAKRAFDERDVDMARDLVRQDDVVDNLNRDCFRLALEIGDDADRREWAMTMLLAARAIERIGDNAVDIGEQVAFVVTGLFREFEDASHPTLSVSSFAAIAARLRSESSGNMEDAPGMLCAAIDIGSNTTRVLVAEPVDGQLKKVMEQRAYTRINKAIDDDGAICPEKIEEVAEVVATQVRLARELGAETIRAVATAAVREATNGEQAARAIGAAAGVEVEILSDEEEGRLSFIGATKTLGHPVAGTIGVVDVGGGSTEVILGTVPGGAREVRSWKVGSGALADELLASDPPSAAEIRKVRDRIDDIFEGVEIEHPAQAVAVGGSATSLRKLVGAVLEYETLERGVRVLCGDPGRRRRPALRARPRTGPHPRHRRAAAREDLRAARPAAADRQGRPARGGHPRPPQRQRQRLLARAPRRLAA